MGNGRLGVQHRQLGCRVCCLQSLNMFHPQPQLFMHWVSGLRVLFGISSGNPGTVFANPNEALVCPLLWLLVWMRHTSAGIVA